ncbi:MAG: hypothetical protein MJZ74_04385 [Muribaculaceae bacterium]|nr:hypothetical protein [Muribaculaceae bacterium]
MKNKQMKNTMGAKEKLAVGSGLGMLIFGIALTVAGFIVPPLGEVHDSVLWIMGQALIYCGSIFGLSIYTHHKIIEIENRLNKGN